MKTLKELQDAVNEIRRICKKHGIVLIGTCENEGIYGEITISENIENEIPWSNPGDAIDNTVIVNSYDGNRSGTLGGIGDLTEVVE